jgi:phospholipid/cholesterol/gamma-HCH transport system substrate-binding protein
VASRPLASVLALVLLFTVGLVAAGYVLIRERLPVPLRSTYSVQASLTAADGIVPGLGQPVNVAGVQVGSITGARVAGGMALLTLQLDRGQVPRVYADAAVTLQPVTPLGDVEIDLTPGGPPARPLSAGTTIAAGDTVSPVVLEDLMRSLDGDTRSWLGSLIASLGQGTAGQGDQIRSALAALGPSAAQVRRIAAALAVRRVDLAHLVHDLAVVTRAASSDRQLGELVRAGDVTLHAIAAQAPSLGQAIRLMPASLTSLDTTLAHLQTFSDRLTPTLDALLPTVRRLPSVLGSLRPFAESATGVLRASVRPFVARAAPLVTELGPAAVRLSAATPFLTSAVQVFQYVTNELAYNPGGANQGYLYWMDWFFHNWDSVFSSGDANGISPRANVLANCNALAAAGPTGSTIEAVLGLGKLC